MSTETVATAVPSSSVEPFKIWSPTLPPYLIIPVISPAPSYATRYPNVTLMIFRRGISVPSCQWRCYPLRPFPPPKKKKRAHAIVRACIDMASVRLRFPAVVNEAAVCGLKVHPGESRMPSMEEDWWVTFNISKNTKAHMERKGGGGPLGYITRWYVLLWLQRTEPGWPRGRYRVEYR